MTASTVRRAARPLTIDALPAQTHVNWQGCSCLYFGKTGRLRGRSRPTFAAGYGRGPADVSHMPAGLCREGKEQTVKEEKAFWEGKSFSFFSNKSCEFYPCHPVAEGMDFNCLFCYCPLYMLGRRCGGSFTYLENGVKDCSRCLLPHRRENYGLISESFQKIAQTMAEQERGDGGADTTWDRQD